MSETTYDIADMLDSLGMTTAAIHWKLILNDPEFGNFTAQQLFREVITPQYLEAMNKRYETNLKFSRLMEKNARIESKRQMIQRQQFSWACSLQGIRFSRNSSVKL